MLFKINFATEVKRIKNIKRKMEIKISMNKGNIMLS